MRPTRLETSHNGGSRPQEHQNKNLESNDDISFRELVRRYEAKVVEAALQLNRYNESRTAKYLKMDRNTLRRIRARARKRNK